MEERLSHAEEEILRRVFTLGHLSSICYANYRWLSNDQRDYDYVNIKNKTLERILQSLYLGRHECCDFIQVKQIIQNWENMPMLTGSYHLDKEARQLVCLPSEHTSKPVVIIERCPDSDIRLCFLISFMKQYIPDLLGERQVQSFNKESFQENPMKLIACDAGRQQEIMNILAHYLTCSYCNTR